MIFLQRLILSIAQSFEALNVLVDNSQVNQKICRLIFYRVTKWSWLWLPFLKFKNIIVKFGQKEFLISRQLKSLINSEFQSYKDHKFRFFSHFVTKKNNKNIFSSHSARSAASIPTIMLFVRYEYYGITRQAPRDLCMLSTYSTKTLVS